MYIYVCVCLCVIIILKTCRYTSGLFWFAYFVSCTACVTCAGTNKELFYSILKVLIICYVK